MFFIHEEPFCLLSLHYKICDFKMQNALNVALLLLTQICVLDDVTISRITGKSFPAGKQSLVSFNDLRLLKIPYYDFDGKTQTGEMIVNKAIAEDVADIFNKLFEVKYPIGKIRLIDEYDADDEKSMTDNNSSSFCYRSVTVGNDISKHALGMAIDINPLYNPYVKQMEGREPIVAPKAGTAYTDRSKACPYFIRHGDYIVKLFKSKGFSWGGDWSAEKKDYQHFEKELK